MASERRLLLPRRISAERIVIERRKPGLPAGRIVVELAEADTGSAVIVRAGIDPRVAALSAGVIGLLSVIMARLAGAWTGMVTAAVLATLEVLRWRHALAGTHADAAWLRAQLKRS